MTLILELGAQKSLAEKVREIGSDVPAGDLAWMPADALDQIDQSVYGLPKRNGSPILRKK